MCSLFADKYPDTAQPCVWQFSVLTLSPHGAKKLYIQLYFRTSCLESAKQFYWTLKIPDTCSNAQPHWEVRMSHFSMIAIFAQEQWFLSLNPAPLHELVTKCASNNAFFAPRASSVLVFPDVVAFVKKTKFEIAAERELDVTLQAGSGLENWEWRSTSSAKSIIRLSEKESMLRWSSFSTHYHLLPQKQRHPSWKALFRIYHNNLLGVYRPVFVQLAR